MSFQRVGTIKSLSVSYRPERDSFAGTSLKIQAVTFAATSGRRAHRNLLRIGQVLAMQE
jgi:hypothetical protein